MNQGGGLRAKPVCCFSFEVFWLKVWELARVGLLPQQAREIQG